LFVACYRAENTHAFYAVFGGMFALVVAQQLDIVVCRRQYCLGGRYFTTNI
jgi:hypothetical protein